jgi:hypothetical protein
LRDEHTRVVRDNLGHTSDRSRDGRTGCRGRLDQPDRRTFAVGRENGSICSRGDFGEIGPVSEKADVSAEFVSEPLELLTQDTIAHDGQPHRHSPPARSCRSPQH